MDHHHHHHQPPPSSSFHHYQPPQPPPPSFLNNINHFSKEHMFEKPLTPSDVGKLNRLVIPKQHAEKYFPMASAATQQKGFLLSFEDECGKLWRFRYSYWNSSQSYVLTKGWSRYVKEKRLDAGDVVLFERLIGNLDCDKMFIGWRCRTTQTVDGGGGGGGGAHVSTAVFRDVHSSYTAHPSSVRLPYQPDFLHAGGIFENVDNCERGVVATRRLRLFGVNLECPDNPEPSTPDGSSHVGQSHHQYGYNSNDLHLNMQMRYQEEQEEEG